MTTRPHSRTWALALLSLGLSFLAALLVGQRTANSNQELEKRAFDNQVEQFSNDLRERLRTYEYGVRGARGAVIGAGGTSISRTVFEDYVRSRDLPVEFPGARGFGYIRRVPAAEVEAFLDLARAEQRPDFAIRQLGPNAGERWVIQYIEPEAQNRRAIGLDIASDSSRLEAARRSMNSNSAKLTAPITLVQAGGQHHSGFLLVLPVYRPGAPTGSIADRQRACIGWAYAPLAIDEVLDGLVSARSAIDVELVDISGGQHPKAFYTTRLQHSAGTSGRSATRTLSVFGREWRIQAQARPAAHHLPLPSPWLNALATALIGSLLSALILVFLRGRERRQEQQRAQNLFTASLIDAIPQALLAVDETGRIVHASRRASELFGYPPAALLNKSVDELLPSSLRQRHAQRRAHYDHARRSMGKRGELWALHANGEPIAVEIDLNPLQINGRRLTVAGITDATEQRQNLRVIEQNEARWRQIANSMPQLVWTCRAEGPCDFLSDRWVSYTGVPESEQLGYGWLEQVHPDDRARLDLEWQAAVSGHRTLHVEFRIRRHDGVYRWFDTQAVPLLDDSGVVQRWVGSNTDIDERKQTEHQLLELNRTLESRVDERTALLDSARRDLQAILDAMPSMVGYWDRDLRNRFANHAYLDWFKIDPKDLPGRHIRDLLGPETYERNRVYIEGAVAGEPQQFERSINGRHSLARYIPDIVEGEVRGFYAFVTDVTQLKQATQAAEAASAAKSTFLANMSHEIRTPMNAVMNLCYLLGQSPLSADQRDLLAKMSIASRSLLGLINDVLDLSKIEAGQMGLSAEAFSIRSVVDEAVKVMSSQAQAKGIVLDSDIDAEIPNYVRGDSLRLGQVLTNLLSNAIKFTDRGGVHIEVRRDPLNTSPTRLRFSIRDTGVGIAPATLSKLFQPFTQADETTTRRFGGSGLGLAIVKRLVELMGGEVGADSEPRVGSRFWFSLDLSKEDEATIPSASPKPLHILIADDDANQAQHLARTARGLGWRVETVDSGNAALNQMADRKQSEQDYDALLLDCRMPGLDGLQTLAELRRRYPDRDATAVILVTNYDVEELASTPEADRADTILHKPISSSALFDAVHAAVARRSKDSDRAPGTEYLPAPGSQRLPGVRILLVDDSPINLEVARRILEREGASVELASNGQLALDALGDGSSDFDAVLMDVQMPVLDGHEATRRIRSQPGLQNLPVIALTAGALLSERQRALEAGMNEFISKPFDAEIMIGLLRRTIETYRRAPLAVHQASTNPQLPDSPAPIDGINLDDASMRIGGDWGLLRNLLQRMFEEFAADWPTEEALLETATRTSLAARAHKLRGVAGNVGAEPLREHATRLELMARDSNHGDLCASLQQLLIELDRLKLSCSDFLQQGTEPAPATALTSTLDPTALEALRLLLKAQNLAALDAYEAMTQALKLRLGDQTHARLNQAIQALQFKQALELLQQADTNAG